MQCPSPSVDTSTPRARPVGTSTLQPGPSTSPPREPPSTPATADIDRVDSDTSASSPAPLPADIENENVTLKAEVAKLRAEMRVILDHSIESDQRLLQYTNEVFTAGTSTADSVSEPQHTATQTDEVGILNVIADKVDYKKQTMALQQELQTALLEIERLEEVVKVINAPCEKCTILSEETKNMIESIKILELDNRNLKLSIRNSESQPVTTAISPSVPLFNRFQLLTEDEPGGNNFKTITYKKPLSRKPRKNKETINIKPKRFSDSLPINKNVSINFRNVSIIGDSHVRHLAENVRRGITESTRVTGVCKPNAGLLSIAPTSDPPPDHCYVLIGGTNDVDAERQDIIFDHMESVIRQCGRRSRVLVCPLPPRYDLPASSPVHETIARSNRHIANLCSRNDRAEVLDINGITRRYFTAHGLHFRASGKRLLSNIIVKILSRLTPLPVCGDVEASLDSGLPTILIQPSPIPGAAALQSNGCAGAAAQPPVDNEDCPEEQSPVKFVFTNTSDRQSFLA